MKALYVAIEIEESKTIHQMVNTQFPKITLLKCFDLEKMKEILTSEGPFAFLIFDVDNRTITIENFFETVEELTGKKATVLVGSINNVKAYVTAKILNEQGNYIAEKPFTLDEFKDAISNAIEWTKKEEFEESIAEFSREDLHPMKIRNFQLFDQLPYDVYLELTSTKFGKIISKNKPFGHQIIHSYAKKNIKHLYLRKDEFLKFLDSSVKSLLKIYDKKITDRKKLIALHLKTAFFMHQYIRVLNVSEEINRLMIKYIQSVSSLCRSHEKIIDLFDDFPPTPQLTFAYQAAYSSYLCHYMLINMGWHADMSKDKLILACMLQDITLSNDDLIKIRSLNDPNLKMFTETEQEEFKNHPLQAALVSNYFSGFTEVDFILAEHHEHPNGEGFPKGLNSSSLTTISCIMILAASFTSRLAIMPKSPQVYIEIYKQMFRVYNAGNFKLPLKALEKSLKT